MSTRLQIKDLVVGKWYNVFFLENEFKDSFMKHIGMRPHNVQWNGKFIGMSKDSEAMIEKNELNKRGRPVVGYFGDDTYRFEEAEAPLPPPTVNIPEGQADLIMFDEIPEGTRMADFHGERARGRFYTEQTYRSLDPKRNPSTRKTILPSEVTLYTAHLDPSLPVQKVIGGGKRRKTKRRGRKTRRSRK